ncbi:MAG: hypothetical protein DRI71_02455, partial [Bacteroidetes bacterium]
MPDIYLTERALYVIFGLVFVFITGFAFNVLIVVGQIMLLSFILALVIELSLLYSIRKPFRAERITEDKLSNGDFNMAILKITSAY